MTKEEFNALDECKQKETLVHLARWYRHMDSEQAGSDLPPLTKYLKDLEEYYYSS